MILSLEKPLTYMSSEGNIEEMTEVYIWSIELQPNMYVEEF